MSGYPLAVPSWDESEYAAIQSVVDSGMFSMGDKVAEFERAMCEYLGSKYCVMVNSGSSANLLMVASLFYKPGRKLSTGDEVLVPAISWSTTYFPLQQYGLKLRFIDVDPNTLNYDLGQLESAITGDTRAIMAVNLLGNPNDFTAISRVIGEREIFLLEDNCESLGATFDDRQAGTFGHMGTYSSFFSHHISTMEGGVITTDDEALYHTLLCLRAHGWTRNLPQENHVCGTKSDDPFVESFRFVLPGYNLRPLEMSGAIGIEQLKKLPSFVAARRANAEYFIERIGKIPGIRLQKEIGDSSWFGFAIIIESEASVGRAAVLKELAGNGVEVRPIVTGNFARSEAVQWMDCSSHGDLPNADYVDQYGFMVGNHHYPLQGAIDLLGNTLDKVLA